MPKVKIKVTTVSNNNENSYEIPAILQEEKILYREPDKKKTHVTFDYSKDLLIRDNKEISMIYKFNSRSNTIGNVEVKDLGRIINLNIETKRYLKNNKNVEISFLVEEEEIKYKIEVLK